MLFDNWHGLLRVLLMGVSAYLALIAILRLSGKRTLAKMNAFDLVVTVAIGSTLATILLSKDVALAEGVLGFVVLVLAQYLIARLSVHVAWIERLAKSQPRTLLVDGEVLQDALISERVTREEVLCAVRSHGLGDLAMAAAVVLETDGSFSVVARDKAGAGTALPDRARGS